VGRSLSREDGSVVCNCYWTSPAQSFSGQSPLGLATTFYCLSSRLPFLSPPTTRRVTVEVFDPASTRVIGTPIPTPDRVYKSNSTNHQRELRQTIEILKAPHVYGLAPENYQNRSPHWRDKFSVWYQHKKHKYSHSLCTGRRCSFLTSALITGVKMGEVSKLGWLIGWSTTDMWGDSCMWCLFQTPEPSLLLQHIS
jgi:hypothetical protein